MRIISLVLLLTLGLNGCFAYVPSGGGPLRQGAGVRAVLKNPQDVRLVEVTANNVAVVEGEVVRADAETVLLSARTVISSSGYEQLGGGATVEIPRGNIERLEERRFSTVRSAGLAGIVVALTAVTAAAATGLGIRGGGSGGPPGRQ